MKVRYKKSPETIRYTSDLNKHSLFEVNLHDDSAPPSDLEVFLKSKNEWKCMDQAFKDKDLVTDNLNLSFMEPKNPYFKNTEEYNEFLKNASPEEGLNYEDSGVCEKDNTMSCRGNQKRYCVDHGCQL